MKRLTKYKDGKFLLNHSSMNEAIEKLGIYELVDELNATKEYYYKYNNGEIEKSTISWQTIAIINFNEERIEITFGCSYINRILEFKDYKHTWALTREDLEGNANDIR